MHPQRISYSFSYFLNDGILLNNNNFVKDALHPFILRSIQWNHPYRETPRPLIARYLEDILKTLYNISLKKK